MGDVKKNERKLMLIIQKNNIVLHFNFAHNSPPYHKYCPSLLLCVSARADFNYRREDWVLWIYCSNKYNKTGKTLTRRDQTGDKRGSRKEIWLLDLNLTTQKIKDAATLHITPSSHLVITRVLWLTNKRTVLGCFDQLKYPLSVNLATEAKMKHGLNCNK